MKKHVFPLLLLVSHGAAAEVVKSTDDKSNTIKAIEKITVTATRTDSSLTAVDRNLYTLDEEALKLVEHEHISQSFVRVPGGWISRGNGQEHLTAIRSPVLTGAGSCGAFFMAEDGVALRGPGFCNANQLFDSNTEQAQRIEILRGPASTLYGANAVHGVINIFTPDPLIDNPTSVGLTIGPHDYYRGDFKVGQSFDDQAFTVYGNVADDGGYKDDSGFEQQKVNGVHQYKGIRLRVKSVLAITNLNQETAGFVDGFEAYKNNSLKKHNPNPEAYRDSQSVRAYSKISYQLDDDRLISITPYFRWADMAFLQHFVPWKPLEENDQTGFGLLSQYQHTFDDVTWLAGLDIDSTQGNLSEVQADSFSATIPAGAHYDYRVNANVIAPFTHLQWQATDQLQLSAGMRFEYSKYDYDNKLTDGSACAVGVANCRFTRPQDQVVTYDELSYQMGGLYDLGKQQYLYAQYSTGYRAPQTSELFRLQSGQTLAQLDAEHIDSYELGLRGQVSEFFYDVSVFSMQKDNFIFQDSNRFNVSEGQTSHNGFEFTFSYQLPYNLYVNASGTYAKHEYDSSLTLSKQDINGFEIDTAPKNMGSVQVGWKTEDKQLELEWVNLGSYFVDPENTAKYAGHDLLNLRANMAVTKQLSLSARLLNVLDTDYADRADYSFGEYRYFVGEPRGLFISAKYQFD